MANDIVNCVDASGTGLQTIHSIRMGLPGSYTSAGTYYAPANIKTIDIADIADKYDTRLDDPTYYN